MIQLYLHGFLHKNKNNFPYQYIDKHYEMPIMDSLLIIIVELFYLVKIIFAHDMQFHKYSYVRSITSALLPYKIFFIIIDQYLMDHTKK